MRTTVTGGSKIQPLRDAAIGGVGLNFLVTTNNAAEVSATYTSALQILNTGAATFFSSVTTGGDLLVGATSSAYSSASRGLIVVNGSTNCLYGFSVGGVSKGYLYHEGTNVYLENSVNGGFFNLTQVGAGYFSFNTNGSEKLRITSGGVVQIANSSGTQGAIVSTERLNVNGSIYAYGDVIAYSDKSVKTNIRPIENVLERITKSRGVVYDRTDVEENDNIGFIAQELNEQFPELICEGTNGTMGVKYQNAVAILFEAIKEQQKQIANQQLQIEELKAKIG
jgi:hypothetical protein